MRTFNVIFYGDANSKIFNIDVMAKDWSLMKAGDATVVKFFKEDDSVLAIFRWDCLIGICDISGLNPHQAPEEEVSYESVEV